jgi:two-component system C4-dicarboxylate transport response regulator DctD
MPESTPILFIDDEEHVRRAGSQTLELSGYKVISLDSADNALELISRDWPGVIVSDIRMPGISGLELLSRIKQTDADIPVILISGHADIATAVQAIRDGAYDFLEKPYASEQLVETVRRAAEKRLLTLENRQLRKALEAQNTPGPRIIGKTPAIQQLRSMIMQLADTDADVLILGETGTGKELVAHSLHEQSRRHSRNFVPVNCGAVPDTLIESELFGHEAGAFTGAKNKRVGRFEYADGGTLFLDEIESMPLPVQVHLLRVLQERKVERLGSNKAIELDLRVVAATKVELKNNPEFREDLYYRLNVVTITIPPLRERLEDIPLLFQHFLLVASSRYGREVPPLKQDQLAILLNHKWPGNVRELRNTAERYVLVGESVNFDLEQLMFNKESENLMTLPKQVEYFEKSLIEQELIRQKGNLKACMENLGLPRKTLYDKMKKYELDKSEYKED